MGVVQELYSNEVWACCHHHIQGDRRVSKCVFYVSSTHAVLYDPMEFLALFYSGLHNLKAKLQLEKMDVFVERLEG